MLDMDAAGDLVLLDVLLVLALEFVVGTWAVWAKLV